MVRGFPSVKQLLSASTRGPAKNSPQHDCSLALTLKQQLRSDLRARSQGSHSVTWVGEVPRPILAVHPSEGRALTASRPAERRPMSLGGSLRPGQAEAGPPLLGSAVLPAGEATGAGC